MNPSEPTIPPAFWVVFAIVVAICLAIDLLAHRGRHADNPKRALAWSAGWIAVSVAFGGLVTWRFGSSAGEEFFSAYLLEKSLSVDNLFVFVVVFERLRIDQRMQRKVLLWGVLGALVLRGIFIGLGAVLLARWHVLVYALGALLVFTGVKLARESDHDLHHKEPRALAWIRRKWGIGAHGKGFFTRENGKLVIGPALLALVVIEITDVAFALDSIPAVFAITESPFIVYTSNVLAVLGLRALYVALADVLTKARYLRHALAFVLTFAGAKMLLSKVIHVPPLVSVLVIGGAIGAAVLASYLATRRARGPRKSTT